MRVVAKIVRVLYRMVLCILALAVGIPLVIIIMVNTSNKPDQSQLLKGLPNKILHAESLQKAAEVITAELKSP